MTTQTMTAVSGNDGDTGGDAAESPPGGPLLALDGITVTFPGVRALDAVSLSSEYAFSNCSAWANSRIGSRSWCALAAWPLSDSLASFVSYAACSWALTVPSPLVSAGSVVLPVLLAESAEPAPPAPPGGGPGGGPSGRMPPPLP